MEIRNATINDLDKLAEEENKCFPASEAASRESIAERLKYYPDHFWLMFDGDKLIVFVDGMVTDILKCLKTRQCTMKTTHGR